ncbi:MAG TPA: VOC family protein [Acidobacteriota bacterium]|nr:VOC family protein [Acidobacteriota bacterium]
MMLGIGHVALRVRDIRRSVDFYTRFMRMRIDWRPDPRNAYLTSGSDNLALHEVGPDQLDSDRARGSLDHFGFLVSRPEEVDEWAASLEAGGIALVQKPKTHRDGARSIYFHDPDGNLIQLICLEKLVKT